MHAKHANWVKAVWSDLKKLSENAVEMNNNYFFIEKSFVDHRLLNCYNELYHTNKIKDRIECTRKSPKEREVCYVDGAVKKPLRNGREDIIHASNSKASNGVCAK